MLKWGKVDSLYHNDDPYLFRRRWRWQKCLPLVVIILAGWCAVAWWAGTLWAGR